jgi:hypothetical protein
VNDYLIRLWQDAVTPRRSRRWTLRSGVLMGAGLTGAFAAACGSDTKTEAPPAAKSSTQLATQAAQASPQPGGTLNAYLNFNPMLDPQK